MTTPKTPKAQKPTEAPEPTPSEQVDADLERREQIEELLKDLPTLRDPKRFRIRHRNAFHRLFQSAQKSGILDDLADARGEDGTVDLDVTEAEALDITLRLTEFIADIDEWAETIADDPEEYAAWAESHSDDVDVFMALFSRYQEALGESNSSGV